jgi:hypothetical protein
LKGIDVSRLSTETGDSTVMPMLKLYLDNADEGNFPGAFRIESVSPGDVIAVHDLTEWLPDEICGRSLWRPDHGRVEDSRKSPEQ